MTEEQKTKMREFIQNALARGPHRDMIDDALSNIEAEAQSEIGLAEWSDQDLDVSSDLMTEALMEEFGGGK